MCGRFMLARDARALADEFGVEPPPQLAPRYNIAPGQPILIVRTGDAGREALLVKWGLVPFWADDPAIGNRLINARSETAASKPAFRAAVKRRRCLVPADGYYEWQVRGRGKQPYLIDRADGGCIGLAGLWEHWEYDGSVLLTACLLTCAANAHLAAIHDRMPVVIAPADYARWLDPNVPPARVADCLAPSPDHHFVARAVSARVNSPRHDDPGCIAPLPQAS